jgi:peroxiredoxin
VTTNERRSPVQPGDPAPQFTLPLANEGGSMSLDAYRGRSPVYLALFRGLYCHFCRRHVVLLSATAQKLEAVGVRTLGVVATEPERARLYFRFRPSRVPVGADPDLVTHQAYGLPNFALTPETNDLAQAVAARELRRLNQPESADPLTTLKRLDGYELTELDEADFRRHQAQLTGQFLIDREGIVRYSYIECAQSGPMGFGETPSEEEILTAARALR